MNIHTKNNTAFPQVVEIPQPLEVHPSVSPLAAELLMKVADKITRTPDCYDQGAPECGSVACIIGHMTIEAGLGLDSMGGKHMLTETASAIGMTVDQVQSFYWRNNWPIPAFDKNRQTTPERGVARIEHFLRTGE